VGQVMLTRMGPARAGHPPDKVFTHSLTCSSRREPSGSKLKTAARVVVTKRG